jgi:hypothetical protein
MNEDSHRVLGRVEGKLDMLIEGVKLINDKQAKLDERVDSIERDAHTGKYMLTLLGTLAGFVGANFATILQWFRT